MPAQFTKHFVQDLQQDIKIRQCGTIVFNKDNESNVISVDLYNGQEEYSGGGSVAGACICPDGSTVPLTGSIDGKTASVILTGDCFAFPGQIGIGVQVVSGTVKTTVLKAIYNVELFETDDVVDPGSRITASVGQLVADIEAATAEIPASDMASLMSGIAPMFSASTNYAAGAYVYYSGTLYRFTADHAAGSWTGTDATAVALGNDLYDVKRNIENDYIVPRYSNSATPTTGQYPLEMGYWRGDAGAAVSAVTGAGTTKTCLINQILPLEHSARLSINDSTVYRYRLRIVDISTSNVISVSDFISNDSYVYLNDYPGDVAFCIHFGKIDNTALSSSDLEAISAAFNVYYDVDDYDRNQLENLSKKNLFTNKREYALTETGNYTFSNGACSGSIGNVISFDSSVTTAARTTRFYLASSSRISINDSDTYLMRVFIVDRTSRVILRISDRQSKDYYIYLSDFSNEIAIAVDVSRRDGADITASDIETISEIFGVYYSNIDRLTTTMQTERTVTMLMELGSLSNPNYLLYDQQSQYDVFYYTMRTPCFLDLRMCASYKITTGYDLTAVYYDKSYTYLSTAEITSGAENAIPSDACFARFLATKTDGTAFTFANDSLTIVCNGEADVVKAIDSHGNSSNITMCYVVPGQIGRDHSGSTAQIRPLVDTTGLIRLPPNYTNTGEPVPLIVYVHGSTDYEAKWQSAIRGLVGNQEVITYLVNEGFAVFDSYGHSSDAQITGDSGHTYGSVDCSNCYIAGIRRIIEVYNVRNDGVFVTGISSGGLTAINLAFGSIVPVLACAPLAPAISLYNRCLGYTEEQRREYAWAMGFEGDASVLAGKNGASPTASSVPPFTTALFTYLRDNAFRTIGYNPMWNGIVNVPLDTLVDWGIAIYSTDPNRLGGGDRDSTNWENVYRTCKTPIKIWVANDDHNVPPSIIKNFLKTLQNGNCIGELRLVPDGQGGHYAYTSSQTTERVSGVTSIGVTYTDIPIYWLEMVAFFRSF